MLTALPRSTIWGLLALMPALIAAEGDGCDASVCRAQQASFPALHCVQLPQGYRWNGSACVEIRGCPGTCQGADCDALYRDEATCVDAHRECAAAP